MQTVRPHGEVVCAASTSINIMHDGPADEDDLYPDASMPTWPCSTGVEVVRATDRCGVQATRRAKIADGARPTPDLPQCLQGKCCTGISISQRPMSGLKLRNSPAPRGGRHQKGKATASQDHVSAECGVFMDAEATWLRHHLSPSRLWNQKRQTATYCPEICPARWAAAWSPQVLVHMALTGPLGYRHQRPTHQLRQRLGG